MCLGIKSIPLAYLDIALTNGPLARAQNPCIFGRFAFCPCVQSWKRDGDMAPRLGGWHRPTHRKVVCFDPG